MLYSKIIISLILGISTFLRNVTCISRTPDALLIKYEKFKIYKFRARVSHSNSFAKHDIGSTCKDYYNRSDGRAQSG